MSPRKGPKVDRRATRNLPWDEWLTAWWGTVSKGDSDDLVFAGLRSDRRFLYGALCLPNRDEHGRLTEPSIIAELEARGYDTTTLEIRIKKKVTPTP